MRVCPQRLQHAEYLDLEEGIGAELDKQSELREQIAELELELASKRPCHRALL